MGGGSPSPRGEQLRAALASLLRLEHGHRDAFAHLSVAVSCLPEELRGCPGCVLLPLGPGSSGAGTEAPPSVVKYCSSCVLQSVSHADRTVSMSHTEIMPLAYRNMYSQPCSPPLCSPLLPSSGMCQNVCGVQWFGVEVRSWRHTGRDRDEVSRHS